MLVVVSTNLTKSTEFRRKHSNELAADKAIVGPDGLPEAWIGHTSVDQLWLFCRESTSFGAKIDAISKGWEVK